MEHDAWFFVGIFAFIFLIWVAVGGPTHPLAYSGPRLALPGALGGGSYLSLPSAPFGIGTGNVTLNGGSGGSSGGSNGGTYVPPPVATSSLSGIGFGTPSPYRGEIYLNHGVSGAGSSNPNNEYLQFSLAQNAPGPVTITGWRVESDASGNAVSLPVGVDTPRSGLINGGLPIVLKPGDRVDVISGQSPIGASFLENKCIGYFSQFQKFVPQLPYSCPAPLSEMASYYGADYIRDNACVTYVNSLGRCQAVLTPPSNVSGNCASFLTNYLNYNGCVNTHERDSDFDGHTWRVYLGRSTPMWRSTHEVVKLLDADGKTIDAFAY